MTAKVINRILAQKSQATGEERVFRIYDEKFINITIKDLMGEKKYDLNLSMLEPWPSRHRYFSLRWLIGIIYFGIATLAYGAYLYDNHSSETLGRLLPFIVIFILLALGSLLMFMYRSPHVTEFRSRYCGCTLISLLYNNPGKDEFESFVEEIKNRILGASSVVKIDKNLMLINEIKKLRRLTDQGILTKEQCERAMKRIPNMRA